MIGLTGGLAAPEALAARATYGAAISVGTVNLDSYTRNGHLAPVGDQMAAGLTGALIGAITPAPLARPTISALGPLAKPNNLVNTAAEAVTPQVTKNRATGNAFRDEIADLLSNAGRDVQKEVYKKTPFGARYIDIEVSLNGKVLGGIETKVGGSLYTPKQRAKDFWLDRIENYKVQVIRKF